MERDSIIVLRITLLIATQHITGQFVPLKNTILKLNKSAKIDLVRLEIY